MQAFENIEVEITEEHYKSAVEIFLQEHLSPCSLSIFTDQKSENFNEAVTRAIFNETAYQAIKESVDAKSRV